jgi:hypothetical protein
MARVPLINPISGRVTAYVFMLEIRLEFAGWMGIFLGWPIAVRQYKQGAMPYAEPEGSRDKTAPYIITLQQTITILTWSAALLLPL